LHRTIIPGPPGTGKTHRLMELLDNELSLAKTDPEKIAYIAFSNAAANEAKKRITNDKIIVSTMHAFGCRELQLNTSSYLLKGEKWKGFKNFSSVCADLSFESYINESGYPQYKNSHMKIIEYARNKKISLGDAAVELDLHYSTDVWLTEQIYADLETYKEQTGMFEYSDMISKFVEEDKCPPLHCVFLDEAQDLSPLQWDMFFYIESKCTRSYIAGDDDQTIYTFQGADPNIFIDLKGQLDPQILSRRVPRKIHKLAESIFPHMTNRLVKKWKPRDAEGKVIYNIDFFSLDLSKDNWFILTRTNKMMERLREHLYNLNLRFDSKAQEILPKKMLSAYRVWTRLNQGASVSKDEVKDLWDYLTVKQGHLVRGYAGGKTLETIDSINIEGLREHHGLRAAGSWETLNFPETSKDYIRTILKSGDDMMSDARIKLSTIHGVKGEECDNVVLFTDLEGIIYHSAQKDADPEHRTFFVGITRAKEKLFITNQDYEYQYNIGGPII
jgi:superfamily I DNA/RNA helicase